MTAEWVVNLIEKRLADDPHVHHAQLAIAGRDAGLELQMSAKIEPVDPIGQRGYVHENIVSGTFGPYEPVPTIFNPCSDFAGRHVFQTSFLIFVSSKSGGPAS